MYGLYLIASYLLFIVSVPLAAHCNLVRNYVLPRLSAFFHVSKVPFDSLLLSVSLVTIFVYVLLNFMMDLAQPIRAVCAMCEDREDKRLTSTTATATTTREDLVTGEVSTSRTTNLNIREPTAGPSAFFSRCNLSPRHSRFNIHIGRAQQQAMHYYPAFVASAVLTWANTNRFDVYGVSLVMIQTLFIFLLPLSYCCPHPLVNHINRIGFQCALLWTLVYAICPRDVGYLIDTAAHDLHEFFTPKVTDVYYTPIL